MTTEQCWKTHSNHKAKAATQWKKAVLKQRTDRLPVQFDIVLFYSILLEYYRQESDSMIPSYFHNIATLIMKVTLQSAI